MKKQPSLHETQLDDILNRVSMIDEKTYKIDDRVYHVYHQSPFVDYVGDMSSFGNNEQTNSQVVQNQLTQHLTNSLYSLFYCGIQPEKVNTPLPEQEHRDAFMDRLSEKNFSTVEPDPNWKIYAIDEQNNAFAQKNGVLRPVTANTFVPQEGPLKMQQNISFYRQKENKRAQTVFYYVYGNTYLAPDSNMIRYYWNITPEGSIELVHHLTRLLNDYRIPFHFKCLNHPDLYNRTDSAVLYIDKQNNVLVKKLLKPIIEAVQSHLKEESPLFTAILAKGVSVAEDPGNGSSFGMSRASAIAQALASTVLEKSVSKTSLKAKVEQMLNEKGISTQNMSINPHTVHALV